ncbi:MAG: TIGR04282 family arsenosugar biosynthesis glycosyltransferase [Gammaproteobacteria bacterium]|nr:TIGR04282 family arsenosugar biosynthesis glycosyltransferase [Gammaproteobacteria bacterium]
MKKTLLIFAKAPIAGIAKTRLIPALGAEGAAKLHRKLAINTLKMATQHALCPVQLWCTPDTEHPFFVQCQKEFSVTLHQQSGRDLGERMAHALQQALQKNDYVIIIGTDCPPLTQDMLQRTFKLLDNSYDSVLIPAIDGGYVLLGLRRFNTELFNHIEWGTEKVLRATRERLNQLQWRWYELPHQWDLDEPKDLADKYELIA